MASLIEDLARRLDTSPKEARQHLQKLLKGLHAYAEREGQASVPRLGTFRQEDGTWTFEPTEALARSVNRSFDDLHPVGISASTNPAASASEDADAPERPSKDVSAAPDSPSADVDEEAAPASPEEPAEPKRGASIFDRQDEEDPESETSEPARGLFTPDSSGEKTPPEEATSQKPASQKEPPSQPSGEQPTSPEEEDDPWALADRSSSEAPEQEISEPESSEKPLPSWTYAALSAGHLVRQRSSLQAGDLRNAQLESPTAPVSPLSEKTDSEKAEDKPGRESDSLEERMADDRTDEASPEATPKRTSPRGRNRRQKSRSGSSMGWLAALLLLLVVGLGAWYVLGQQGTVTGPVAVFQQGDAPSEETAAATADDALDETPTAEGDAGASPASPSATGNNETDDNETSETPSQDEDAFANAARIDRAQGGWTVVVASETSRPEAEQVAQRFAQRFQAQDHPIDVLETTVDGTQRYRVVVGQFASSDQVIQTLEQNSDRFPNDAWGLEIGSE